MFTFKYIAQNERDEQWGLTVCSTGTQHVGPGEAYPPPVHESEYMFVPNKGRIINEYQLIFIVEGRGTLTTASAGSFRINSGDIFLIFPNEWHTYSPDMETGWTEYWIGFSGINIDSRVQAGFFSPKSPVYRIGHDETLILLYNEAIEVAQRQESHFQQLLAGIVNYQLGIVFTKHSNRTLNETINPSIIDKARYFMQENIDRNIDMPAIAEFLNISYSTFRRIFKTYTGMAPAKYYLNMKIQRAKEMLRSTTKSVKEVAFALHFDTPEYFSRLFKKKTGMTPSQFREQLHKLISVSES